MKSPQDISRRSMLTALAAAGPAALIGRGANAKPAASRSIAHGPFEPTWESLVQYRAPDWFRDAKFGIWAHWSAQCVPEQGDWYARQMYIQGHPHYNYHVEHYGHPSKVGFKEIDHQWKAENWDPHALMELYVAAGAKYFVSLANHHDNFDCYNSAHHPWNSVRIGPKRDIVGTWAKIARQHGLRFGVSNHSAHAWHWFQTAYGYDPEGPLAGVRYDGYLKKNEGAGKWWNGLDPQMLYTGPNMPMPDGITSIREANHWHGEHDRQWFETPPPGNPQFAEHWFVRCRDLLDRYHPDLIYFDDTGLPLGQTGLDITAHYYNSNIKRNHGRLEAVVNAKQLEPDRAAAVVLDLERGRADHILSAPWQSDTCIGEWHYRRALFDHHEYKTAPQVIRILADIVSKNGNLLLSIPVRGDGTIDEDEHKFLTELASWMRVNGEAVFATRPFAVFGEGAPEVGGTGSFNEDTRHNYTSEDIRFTSKGDTVYAIPLAWPADGKVAIKSLARGSSQYPHEIGGVEMLGTNGQLPFTRDDQALNVTLPDRKPGDLAYVLKVKRA